MRHSKEGGTCFLERKRALMARGRDVSIRDSFVLTSGSRPPNNAYPGSRLRSERSWGDLAPMTELELLSAIAGGRTSFTRAAHPDLE